MSLSRNLSGWDCYAHAMGTRNLNPKLGRAIESFKKAIPVFKYSAVSGQGIVIAATVRFNLAWRIQTTEVRECRSTS